MSQLDRSIQLASKSFVRDLTQRMLKSVSVEHVNVYYARENKIALLTLLKHNLIVDKDKTDVERLIEYYDEVIQHHDASVEAEQAGMEINSNLEQS